MVGVALRTRRQLVHSTERELNGLNRTCVSADFGWPKVRPAELASRSGWTFGRPIGPPMIRRADKSAEPMSA